MSEKYKVVFRNKTAVKGWQEICIRDPKGAAETLMFLENTPELRLPGKVKKLRGKWKGLLQYDVNYGDRIHYWVNKGNATVYVEYAGPHP